MGIYGKIINEVYFGKTKSLQALENQLDTIIKVNKVKKNKDKINSSPEVLKFDRMMEEEFGFSDFTLIIVNSTMYNAYTLPIGFRLDINMIDPGKYLTMDKTGYRFKKEAGYATIVNITSGVAFGGDFSTSEVLGLILHEVGHNFTSAANPCMCVCNNINIMISQYAIFKSIFSGNAANPATIISTYMGTSIFINDISNFTKNTIKNPAVKFFVAVAKSVIEQICDAMANIGFIQKIVLGIGVLSGNRMMREQIDEMLSKVWRSGNVVKNPLYTIQFLIGYSNETFSDRFATTYGYGSELSSALAKIEMSNRGSQLAKILKLNPIIENIADLGWMPLELVITIFDPHPQTVIRINNQLNILKKELNKNDIDPKMKKRLELDIIKLKNVCDKATDDVQIKNPFVLRKLYFLIMFKIADLNPFNVIDKLMNSDFLLDLGIKRAEDNTKNKK